jgi:SulP family sulfate permease
MVRREITGAEFRSGVAARPGVLHQNGGEILIVQLSGFLFFGTAHRFRLHIQDRVKQIGATGRGFLVIDFQQVTGIDSSASNSFDRLRQTAAASDVAIVLTGVSAAARSTLLGGEDESGDGATLHVEHDLESGVRWCEDALLAADGRTAAESRPLAATLAELVDDRDAADVVSRYCERSVVAPGATLVAQGLTLADIFFVESGNASVEIADGHGRSVYVATVGAGDFVGEIAFYLDDERSASVVAKDEMVVWRLSSEAIERLQAEAPAAALKFHRGMAAMLSRRLARTSRHLSIVAG